MKPKIEIYGFVGKLGTGKNYIAEKVFLPMLPSKPSMVMAFADQLKVEGIVRDKLDRNKVFGEKDEFTRKALQTRGTEEGRLKYGEDIWVRFLDEWITLYASRKIERIIITDCRFLNEVEYIKSLGGKIIKINAPQRNLDRLKQEAEKSGVALESISNHASETSLDDYSDFDYVINNDYGDRAHVQVRDIILDIVEKNKEELVIFCDLDDTICKCHDYYVDVIEKTKAIIAENLQFEIQPNFLSKVFDEAFEKHNGNYFKEPFYKNKFSDSLVSVMKEFQIYFHDDTDIARVEKYIFDLGLSVFNYDYEPLNDSLKAIKKLQEIGKVVIFTIGDRTEQAKKISYLGLTDLSYEIFDHKDETLYRNLKNKYKSEKYIMIGDSYHRDILPSMNVGFDLVIKISKGKSGEHEEGFYEINSLSSAPGLIDTIMFPKNKNYTLGSYSFIAGINSFRPNLNENRHPLYSAH